MLAMTEALTPEKKMGGIVLMLASGSASTEPKSIVDTLVDAAVNDSRLSMCSMVDCAPVRGAKESAKEKTTAHNATVLRGMYCKSLTPCSSLSRTPLCHEPCRCCRPSYDFKILQPELYPSPHYRQNMGMLDQTWRRALWIGYSGRNLIH